LIFDSILWGVVSWYLNRVLPSDYGQRSPWYFPLTLGYWCPNYAKAPAHSTDDDEIVYDESIPVEPVSDTLKGQAREGINIEIRGLTKRFGEKTAVDCLNLSMYNGQITGLLGHNGAGKVSFWQVYRERTISSSHSPVPVGHRLRRQRLLIC
jgi:ABC-type multidrug transport system fused ATPase/permease subunit